MKFAFFFSKKHIKRKKAYRGVHQLFPCSLEEKLVKIQLQLQQPVPCLHYKG